MMLSWRVIVLLCVRLRIKLRFFKANCLSIVKTLRRARVLARCLRKEPRTLLKIALSWSNHLRLVRSVMLSELLK
ncbi:hypothetical protein D3C80_1721920 [compost metagenome]